MILQCNPKAGYLARRQEIDAAVARVMESGWYILGQEVEAFEREFASYLGVAHAVGVGNGTDALELALRAAGIHDGDGVLTVSHTAVATVAAIGRCGAVPLFVDVEADHHTLCPHSLETLLSGDFSPRPKAVIVVHLYGQMADMPAILALAESHGLTVVEDCAQAHGAMLAGKKAGTWGDFGCFSFYPTKNLGALGDAGAVVTNSDESAENVRLLRQYGWRERYVSSVEGVNSRLDELQAAILRVNLQHLDEENERRRAIAMTYSSGLADLVLECPLTRRQAFHVYHQYVVRAGNRDQLRRFLSEKGIQTAIHYPIPVHKQPAYSRAEWRPVELINTESLAEQVLSLPMFPWLAPSDSEQVVSALREFLQS